jgi:hypothetical protein
MVVLFLMDLQNLSGSESGEISQDIALNFPRQSRPSVISIFIDRAGHHVLETNQEANLQISHSRGSATEFCGLLLNSIYSLC